LVQNPVLIIYFHRNLIDVAKFDYRQTKGGMNGILFKSHYMNNEAKIYRTQKNRRIYHEYVL